MATSKLYPTIAPDYRIEQVRAFQQELRSEVDKRKRLLEKNKRCRRIVARTAEALGVSSAALGSTSVGLLATGIGAPVAIPTAAAGALLGLVDLGLSPAARRLEKKARRHSQLKALSEAKMLTISRLLSKGLADGSLSDLEFQVFADEKSAWLNARDDIAHSAEADLRKLAAEFKARLSQIEKRTHSNVLARSLAPSL